MIIGSDVPLRVGSQYSAWHTESKRNVAYAVMRVATYEEWLADHVDEPPEKQVRMAKTLCTYFYEVSVD